MLKYVAAHRGSVVPCAREYISYTPKFSFLHQRKATAPAVSWLGALLRCIHMYICVGPGPGGTHPDGMDLNPVSAFESFVRRKETPDMLSFVNINILRPEF
jgi:hypothetical protein